jgi:hypothetical protein
MAKQVINVGAAVNDGTGDTPRAGGQKINSNFTELYESAATKVGSNGTVLNVVKLTQVAYDELSPPVATTLYIVVD